MKTCKIDFCDSTELVYSGVDAFVLGIPTETYCYDCANSGDAHRELLEGAM
jgi:hypothetical protein